MIEMFQNVNPGLTRRFPISDAFQFDDFTDSELQEILAFKLKTQGLGSTPEAVSVAIEILGRARNGLNFGNGGDVENLISKAKGNYQARQSSLPTEERSTDFIFEAQDFDPDFARAQGAETNLQELFKDVIGCEDIISKLNGFLQVAKGMRAQGLDPRGQIPMNFIFKGPPGKHPYMSIHLEHLRVLTTLPGTGKTTTARKIGQVYYDLGFLSQVEVVECSATDLIGQFVGQTGPKTIAQLERGLGKVLFVDEAYRLGEGMYAQEAVNELVDNITKPKFAGKLVIILAGYDNDMNKLLQVNEGLNSRFADEITFSALSPENCLRVLEKALLQKQIVVPSLKDAASYQEMTVLIAELSTLPGWGNARDVQTLAKSMLGIVYQTNHEKVDQLVLSHEDALRSLNSMLTSRRARANIVPAVQPTHSGQMQQLNDPRHNAPPAISTSISTALATQEKTPPEDQDVHQAAPIPDADPRDPNVTDAIWAQLQADKALAAHTLQVQVRALVEHEEAVRAAEAELKATQELAARLAAQKAHNESEANKSLQERELARIRELELRAEYERVQRGLERKRQVSEEKRKKEQVAQMKLREMGVCSAGFRWIKQDGGYRCAGGSHFVSEGQLGM